MKYTIATVALLLLASCTNLPTPVAATVIDQHGNSVIYTPDGIQAVVTKDGNVVKYDSEEGIVISVDQRSVDQRATK